MTVTLQKSIASVGGVAPSNPKGTYALQSFTSSASKLVTEVPKYSGLGTASALQAMVEVVVLFFAMAKRTNRRFTETAKHQSIMMVALKSGRDQG